MSRLFVDVPVTCHETTAAGHSVDMGHAGWQVVWLNRVCA